MWFTGQNVDADAQAWKTQRLIQHFPTIFAPQPPAAPVATTQATPAPDPTITAPSTTNEDKLLQQLLIKQLSQPTSSKEDNKTFLGMGESEYNRLLLMVHINDNDASKLPRFWHHLAEKNQSKVGKKVQS
jgi:hypothetical protein